MSKVQVDKVVNLSDDGAPQLTYGAELPVGYGLTGAGGLNITGVVTAASAVFSGNVTIGGTLTYEDVTNIDVVGVSTFAGRMNVNSSALFNEGLSVTAGVTTIAGTSTYAGTATYAGDVSIAQNIIHTGDTDTKIHFSAADQISLDTGGTTRVNITSGGNLEMPNDNDYIKIGAGGDLQLVHTGSASIIADSGAPLEIRSDTFKVASGVGTEAFRVNSDGILLVGTTSSDDTAQKLKLYQAGNDNCLLNITVSNSTYSSLINFGDGASYGVGQITYAHSDDSLRLKVNAAERLRIDSSGRILQGKTSTKGSTGENVPTFCNEVASVNPNVFEIANNGTNANSYPALVLSRSDGSSVNDHTAVDSGDQIGELCFIGADGSDRFNTATAIKAFASSDFTANDCPAYLSFFTNGGSASASERLRINYDGQVLIGTSDGTTMGSPDKNLVVGSTTNNEEVALTLNVMEGTNNRRVKFFLDDDDGEYGVDSTASTGVAPFVVRSTGTQQFRFDSDGLKFGTDTAAANGLDDYEYGTWTPTIEGQSSAGTATYPQRRGDYTKIGNRVFVNCYISYNSGTGSGSLTIAGLPFNVKNVSACDHAGGTMMSNITIANADDVCSIVSYTGNNLTKVFFYTTRSAATYTALAYDTSGEIVFSLSYNTK